MRLAPRKVFFPHYTAEYEELVLQEAAKLAKPVDEPYDIEVIRLEDEGNAYIVGGP